MRMLRMNEERIFKVIVQEKIDGVWRRDKPKTTWTFLMSKRANLSLEKAYRLVKDREQ